MSSNIFSLNKNKIPVFGAEKQQEQVAARTSIFFVNDLHGKINPMGSLKIAADRFEKTHKNSGNDYFKLAGGDMKVGMKGKSSRLALMWLNFMGFDLSALGNHELDCGSEDFTEELDDLDKNVKKYLGQDKYNMKFVASNLTINPDSLLSKHFTDFLQKTDGEYHIKKDKTQKATKDNLEKDENNKKIARSIIIEKNGNKYGFIGAVPLNLDDKVGTYENLDYYLEKIKEKDESGDLGEFIGDMEGLKKVLRKGDKEEIEQVRKKVDETAKLFNGTLQEFENIRKNGVYSERKRKDNIAAIQAEVDKLEAEGVNKIILLSHSGLMEEIQIAKNTHGIDIILGGHSHSYIKNVYESQTQDPVMVVQAGRNGDNYVQLDAAFDKEGHLLVNPQLSDSGKKGAKGWEKLGAIPHENINIFSTQNIKPTKEELKTIKEVENLKDEVLKEKKEQVGILKKAYKSVRELKINELIERGFAANPGYKLENEAAKLERVCENPLVSFIADGLRENAKQQGFNVDAVLLTNNHDFLIQGFKEGPIYNRDILNLMPFRNEIFQLEVNGKELQTILEWGTHSLKTKDKKPGLIQVSGLRYTATPGAKESSLGDVTFTDNKEKLNPEKNYNILVDSYFMKAASYSKAKEVMGIIKNKKPENPTGLHKKSSMRKYIESYGKKPFVIEADGRINIKPVEEEQGFAA